MKTIQKVLFIQLLLIALHAKAQLAPAVDYQFCFDGTFINILQTDRAADKIWIGGSGNFTIEGKRFEQKILNSSSNFITGRNSSSIWMSNELSNYGTFVREWDMDDNGNWIAIMCLAKDDIELNSGLIISNEFDNNAVAIIGHLDSGIIACKKLLGSDNFAGFGLNPNGFFSTAKGYLFVADAMGEIKFPDNSHYETGDRRVIVGLSFDKSFNYSGFEILMSSTGQLTLDKGVSDEGMIMFIATFSDSLFIASDTFTDITPMNLKATDLMVFGIDENADLMWHRVWRSAGSDYPGFPILSKYSTNLVSGQFGSRTFRYGDSVLTHDSANAISILSLNAKTGDIKDFIKVSGTLPGFGLLVSQDKNSDIYISTVVGGNTVKVNSVIKNFNHIKSGNAFFKLDKNSNVTHIGNLECGNSPRYAARFYGQNDKYVLLMQTEARSFELFGSTYTHNCSSEWTRYGRYMIFDEMPVSISRLSSNSFGIQLYPNPAKDCISWSFESNHNIGDMDIFDLNGQLMKKINLEEMANRTADISTLPSGLYILKVETTEGQATVKIAVQR